MDEHLKNFRSWYVDVLESLYPIRNAGIATMLISFPLLERYLRQRGSLTEKDDIDARCWPALVNVFPQLHDVGHAERFWRVFRNGLLHQLTPSASTRKGVKLPHGSLTHDVTEPVATENDGSFVVHPKLFSQRVVAQILSDFATFSGVGKPVPQLPTVVAYVTPTFDVFLGTSGRRP